MLKQNGASEQAAPSQAGNAGTGRPPRRPLSPLLAAGLLLLPIAGSICRVQAQGGGTAISRGKSLYAQNKCSICHSIHGKGGDVGPALDGVGKKWTRNKLVAFLSDPSRFNPASAMPAMRGTPADRRAVAAYVMSLGGTPRLVAQQPSIARGQQLFASEHCFYCHRIAGKGGRIGPALDQEARRQRPPSFLLAHFRNPAAVTPGSVMPIIALTDTQVQSLILYVESLKPGVPAPAIVLPSAAEGGSQPSVVEGEALYSAAACRSCHAIGGKGTFVGPQLDDEGGSGHTLQWLLAQFETPDEAAPGTIMPVVQGTDRQLRSLAMYLLSLKAHTTPSAALGRRVYVERNCGYCHGSDAKGGKIGPALIGTRGPAQTDAWMLEHFRDPAAVTPGSVMPRVWAAPWELQSLLDYLKALRG